jgi:ACS family tartrate transporter-like MFS transporter
LPTLIHSLSNGGNMTIGILSAIPYVAAAIAEILVGLHSDRSNERRWHVAVPAFVGIVALLCAAYSPWFVVTIVAITFAVLSVFAMFGPFWAMTASLLEGSAAAAGIALINSVGNLGGFFGPYVIGLVRNFTGNFRGGLIIAAFALTVSGVIVCVLRLRPTLVPRIVPHAEPDRPDIAI